jgi:hypothetical protein
VKTLTGQANGVNVTGIKQMRFKICYGSCYAMGIAGLVGVLATSMFLLGVFGKKKKKPETIHPKWEILRAQIKFDKSYVFHYRGGKS